MKGRPRTENVSHQKLNLEESKTDGLSKKEGGRRGLEEYHNTRPQGQTAASDEEETIRPTMPDAEENLRSTEKQGGEGIQEIAGGRRKRKGRVEGKTAKRKKEHMGHSNRKEPLCVQKGHIPCRGGLGKKSALPLRGKKERTSRNWAPQKDG